MRPTKIGDFQSIIDVRVMLAFLGGTWLQSDLYFVIIEEVLCLLSIIGVCLTLYHVFDSTMRNTIPLDMAAVQEEPWSHQTSQYPQVTILAGKP